MESTLPEMAPFGTPAAPAAAIAREALEEPATSAPAAPEDGFFDLSLEADEELRAAAEAAAEAVAAAEEPSLPPPTRHEIPELPSVSTSRAVYLVQFGLLAAGALAVCVVALATVRPPPPAPAPQPVVAAAPGVEPSRFEPRVSPAPQAAPVRRTATLRARPVRAVAAPVEIVPSAAPPTSHDRAPATTGPVAAPVMEGDPAQALGDPPLSGT